jgi:hypothetical protein
MHSTHLLLLLELLQKEGTLSRVSKNEAMLAWQPDVSKVTDLRFSLR